MSEGGRVVIVLVANIAAGAAISLSMNHWFIVSLGVVMALVNAAEIVRIVNAGRI